jgi:hypothetical protein
VAVRKSHGKARREPGFLVFVLANHRIIAYHVSSL